MQLPIYVIHLTKDREREEAIRKQFTSVGLNFEFIEGVNGKNPDPSELRIIQERYNESHARKMNSNPFSPWEIWCALGHIRVYEKMMKEWIQQALIFEDDAIFDERLRHLIEHFESIVSKYDWEYISLNYELLDVRIFLYQELNRVKSGWLGKILFLPRVLAAWLFSIYEHLQQQNSRIRIVRFHRPLYLAWAYFLNHNWAQKLLSLSTPYLQFPADRLPNQARIKTGLKFFGIAPLLVRQNKEFVSNIEVKK